MAFAADKTSAGSGAWNTAGTWNPNGVPDIDDQVEINHAVTIDCDAACKDLLIEGASLIADPGHSLTIKDAAGTHTNGEHIWVTDDASSAFHSHATRAAPFTIQSESTIPTYRIKWMVEKLAGADTTRVNDFSYCYLKGHTVFLGNQTNALWFNTGDVDNDGVLDLSLPVTRALKIDEIYCEGREYDRVYAEGGHAGTVELSGMIPWDDYSWQVLADMAKARERVALIREFDSVPRAIIESLRWGKREGGYLPFSVTLVEDR